MTKRQTRLFFFVSTSLFAAVFVGMTIDTHRQIPVLTHESAMDEHVLAGKAVWHAYDCTNCHTLLGEGAYYAPDLTKIAKQRGDAYLRAFLKNPSQFYSEERDRRLMPNLHLNDQQIDDVIAFLTWISNIDTNGWPPRPILVKGAAVPDSLQGRAPTAASSDPISLGEALFSTTPPGCAGCHSTTEGVKLVGPTLAGLRARAEERIHAPDYGGSATDAASYIRESILAPNAFVVTGPTYSAGGKSLMPNNFGQTLTDKQVDDLVAYLMSLR